MVLASWSPNWNFLNMLFLIPLYAYTFSLRHVTWVPWPAQAPVLSSQPLTLGVNLEVPSSWQTRVPRVALWGLDSAVAGES